MGDYVVESQVVDMPTSDGTGPQLVIEGNPQGQLTLVVHPDLIKVVDPSCHGSDLFRRLLTAAERLERGDDMFEQPIVTVPQGGERDMDL